MFEVLEGLRNRELTDDQFKLVMAIKENKNETLYDSFQEYWKNRCMNPEYLTAFETWRVLTNYICEMFAQADWRFVQNKIERTYWEKKTLSARDMIDIYLETIHMMQMRYEI